ncbi:uncharacterized protein LOC126264165 isoform X2 [Aethina tumida]|uniref:uncharacterized protein LOC126264165 isoform X2 n=1 Tax=Aethina tumida TaxID=116153 RepID=UPI002148CC19|nr:uncharacterized protein LOC126264165 isoform X2 [Aethina tumida]
MNSRKLKMSGLLAKIAPEKYFPWHQLCLKYFGLTPPTNRILCIVYWILYIPHILTTTLYLSTNEIINLYQLFDTDFKEAMFNSPTVALHLLSAIRTFLWHVKLRDKFNDFVAIVDEDSDYKVYDFNYLNLIEYKHDKTAYSYEQIKAIWRKFNCKKTDEISSERLEIEFYDNKVRYEAKIFCFLYTTMFLFSFIFLMILYYTSSYLRGTYEAFNPALNRTSVYRYYPFQISMPFDTSVSDGYYYWGVVFQLYLYSSNIMTGLTLNTLGVICPKQAMVQLKVVKLALKKVDENIATTNKKTIMFITDMRLVACINRIQNALKSHKLIEDIFNVTFLIQYSMMSLILCGLLYTMLLVDINEFMAFGVCILLILLDCFCLCWFSQSLSEEFQSLIGTIHQLNWVSYSPVLRKKLVFTMMRLKKPVWMTLGKFINVNLSFFNIWIKHTYSAFTLLKAMRDKQL